MQNVDVVLPKKVFNFSYQFDLRFNTIFSCRGCNGNSTLFLDEDASPDNFFGASRLIEDHHLNQVVRQLQSSPMIIVETCSNCEGPLSASFVTSYGDTLQELINNNTITSIQALGNRTFDLEDVPCEEAVFLENDVFVDFTPSENGTEPTAEELQALADSFLVSYNSLNTVNSETYDPFFQALERVEILDPDVSYNRRHLAQTSTTDLDCAALNTTAVVVGNEALCNNTNGTSFPLPRLVLRPVVKLFRTCGRCRTAINNNNQPIEPTNSKIKFSILKIRLMNCVCPRKRLFKAV